MTINGVGTFMIITGAMPAQHFSGVSHHRRRSRQVDHDFAGAVSPEVCELPYLANLAKTTILSR